MKHLAKCYNLGVPVNLDEAANLASLFASDEGCSDLTSITPNSKNLSEYEQLQEQLTLEDCEKVHTPVKNSEPYFEVDKEFKAASYSQRYEHMIRRLVGERLYTAACLTLSSNSEPSAISHPAADLDFARFTAHLRGLGAQI